MIAVILMIVGVLVVVCSFIYAAMKMTHHPGDNRSFGSLKIGDLRAIIGMIIGSLVFWTGAIWGIVLLVKMIIVR
jgi:hypothetical protein